MLGVTACAFCLQGGPGGPSLYPLILQTAQPHRLSYLLTGVAGSMLTLVSQPPVHLGRLFGLARPRQAGFGCPLQPSWATVSSSKKDQPPEVAIFPDTGST